MELCAAPEFHEALKGTGMQRVAAEGWSWREEQWAKRIHIRLLTSVLPLLAREFKAGIGQGRNE